MFKASGKLPISSTTKSSLSTKPGIYWEIYWYPSSTVASLALGGQCPEFFYVVAQVARRRGGRVLFFLHVKLQRTRGDRAKWKPPGAGQARPPSWLRMEPKNSKNSKLHTRYDSNMTINMTIYDNCEKFAIVHNQKWIWMLLNGDLREPDIPALSQQMSCSRFLAISQRHGYFEDWLFMVV